MFGSERYSIHYFRYLDSGLSFNVLSLYEIDDRVEIYKIKVCYSWLPLSKHETNGTD